MNIEDMKLRTLANAPTKVNGIDIHPIRLREIIDYGYSAYNRSLSAITLKRENLINPDYLAQIPTDVGVVDIIFELYDTDFQNIFLDGLKLFLKTEEVTYFKGKGLFVFNKRVSFEDFQEMIGVIKLQNCIISKEEETFVPLNEHAARIRKKMLENRRKIQELNREAPENDSLHLSDLISIVCSNANGIHLLNVFELNMFQFNDQFNRMKLLDEYEVNIQALLHGADAKGIQFTHWISKLK
ncbi:hypothetical protein GK047_19650 [Paenibacillus sp. SYP-B3998]|uniref:Uncharacterized protein n=1 Tax=Paenibacillus sp. SYP-B3998 TaxID=2678564 RepID=A0A6G4A326_9BACL|nr:hypothetical protein [Paenibacillus sp. SYP-B3998]NEW08219.1 hypothetical protein [Paenibacillus sp. SYP-B3998]